MSVEIICTIISAVATIVAASASARVSINTRRTQERAERRAKESQLAMQLMYATCELSIIAAKKLTGQHTNGDVKQAMDTAAAAKAAYNQFVESEAAKNFTKI